MHKKIEWPIDYTDLLRILHVALAMYIKIRSGPMTCARHNNNNNKNNIYTRSIDHFTAVSRPFYSLVAWSLNGSKAGVDLVLIQTSLLLLCKSSCSYAN